MISTFDSKHISEYYNVKSRNIVLINYRFEVITDPNKDPNRDPKHLSQKNTKMVVERRLHAVRREPSCGMLLLPGRMDPSDGIFMAGRCQTSSRNDLLSLEEA